MNEQWKALTYFGFSDTYMVSNRGQVKNTKTGKYLTPYFNKKRGYFYVLCQVGRKRRNFLLHRLVANAFHKNPNNLPCVDHKNFDRKDNSSANLEWVTYQENSRRAFCGGRIPDRRGSAAGKKTPFADEDIFEIYRMKKSGIIQKEIARHYGVKACTISLILNGKRWGNIYERINNE